MHPREACFMAWVTWPAISLALSAEQGVVLDYQEEVMVLLQDGPQLGLR